MSWLQQAYHAATVIRQMQRLALNSGQQQQQQESTGSIGPSSGNPMQYSEQSQISYNQHTGLLGSPPSSNLSNWSRHARRCLPSNLMFMNLTPLQSFPPITRRRYTCATNASRCGATHAPLCPLSFGTMCRNLGNNGSIRRADPRHR